MKEINHGEYFIDRLYYYMRVKNLNVHRVSILAGITNSTLSNIIYRKSAPKLDTIYKVCEGLGISVRDFFDFPPYNQKDK